MDYKKYLNPIVKKLSQIKDTSDIQPQEPLETEEAPHLIRTIELVGQNIDKMLHFIETLTEDIIKQQEQMQSLTGDDRAEAVGDYNKLTKKMDSLLTSTNRYLTLIESPYFGKIQFIRHQTEIFPAANLNIYLGKFAHFDPETKAPIVTDWRAPIANLYYQNAGPTDNVNFTSPLGVQTGDLKQKRQFEMVEGRFHTIYDSKSGNAAADAFLLKQLKNRIGKKLQDIVATIQAQQNDIIREEINKPVIIQGVAGSGKTTIILHRLAYLFFTFPDTIRPENSMIMAPNAMFLDYISDVLPSLGVEGLQQNTYLSWAKSILKWDKEKWDNKYALSNFEDNLEVKKLKGSIKFMHAIEKYIAYVEDDLFEKMPDYLNYSIQSRYQELREQHPNMTVLESLDLSIDYAFAQKQFSRKFAGNYGDQLTAQAERIKKIQQYLNKRLDVYKLYKDLFNHPHLLVEAGFSEAEATLLAEYSRKVFKSVGKALNYKIEDLAPMVWLYMYINDKRDYTREYIVVDEAQDLSEFQLQTVYMTAKNGNITVAGDLAQAIIPPFYINDWNDVKANMEAKVNDGTKVSYHQLFRCYRTTAEVITFANKIFRAHFPASYRLPEAVLRHGDEVKIKVLKGNFAQASKDELDEVTNMIDKQIELGSATIALVCRDEAHADAVYNKLIDNNVKFEKKIFSYLESDYHDGIQVLPVSKAKGLEFDTVILMDVNEEFYHEDALSVRLLYVGITRALHRLYLIHSDKPSKLIPHTANL